VAGKPSFLTSPFRLGFFFLILDLDELAYPLAFSSMLYTCLFLFLNFFHIYFQFADVIQIPFLVECIVSFFPWVLCRLFFLIPVWSFLLLRRSTLPVVARRSPVSFFSLFQALTRCRTFLPFPQFGGLTSLPLILALFLFSL